MNTISTDYRMQDAERPGGRPALLPPFPRVLQPAILFVLLVATGGCGWDKFSFRDLNPFQPPVPTAPETDTFILRAEGLIQEKAPATTSDRASAEMAAARELFRREQYDKAEGLYSRVADNEKNPAPVVQEAMYYHGECLRLQGHYPKASDIYSSLLSKFPNSVYREQCVRHMFDIANYWLDDTRQAMREDRDRRDGKHSFSLPRILHFEKAKPMLDIEGRAIEKLEQVRLHDINGPLADESLFMCGVVKMYNENYREADHYFSQIHARHPESQRAAQALKLAIFCKHMSTGGSDYDGRKAAEARKLIQAAMTSYPQLTRDKDTREWLERQQTSIDVQQAEKDFKMAEFYRRTGHPGSAYFCYELVRRRYPNTEYARKAEKRWSELRAELEKEGKSLEISTNPKAPSVKTPGTPTSRPTPPTASSEAETPKPAPPPEMLPPAALPPNPATLPTPKSIP